MIKHNEYGTAHEKHLSFNCAYCQDELIEKITAERDRYKAAWEAYLNHESLDCYSSSCGHGKMCDDCEKLIAAKKALGEPDKGPEAKE